MDTLIFRNPSNPSYDARYILRPETIESLFIAYRLTANETYRDQGWEIFQSIEKHCRLEGGGYAGVLNVDDARTEQLDRMELSSWYVSYLTPLLCG